MVENYKGNYNSSLVSVSKCVKMTWYSTKLTFNQRTKKEGTNVTARFGLWIWLP